MVKRFFCILLPTILFVAGANASDALGRTAKAFAQAMMDYDYGKITKYSHPSVVRYAGGEKAYAALLEKSYTEAGIRFENMVFGEPTDIRVYGDITLATLPYTMTVNYGAEIEKVVSFYYAFSSRHRKYWAFLDCSNATGKLLKGLVKGYDNKLKTPGKC